MSLRTIFLVLTVLLTVLKLNAQSNGNLPKLRELAEKKQQEELRPLQHKNGLWGYADGEGKFVIRPVFSEVCPYEGKVARVRFAELWGTIGRNGLFVVQPTYYGIDSYSPDSLAVVVLNEKSHLINAKGERVGNVLYDRIEYADYGYKILLDGNYGTMNTKGEVMVEPKFDVMEALDRWRGLEQICVDGKWGILKDGHEILALSFEKKIVLLQQGTSGHPDLYLVDQKGRKGIVTSYGQFVVPCIYDEITISSSEQYYVTRVGDRYGAISLKMDELIAPILESKPFIGEDIFKVYDNGAFYAVNYKGTVPFKDCSDLFNVFRPDDYMSTTSIPEWSKHILIEQNLLDRQEDIDQASIVLDVLKKHGYDLNAVEADESFPDGYDMKIPLSSCKSYGIAEGGMFVKTSGYWRIMNQDIITCFLKQPPDPGNPCLLYLNLQQGAVSLLKRVN